MVEVTRTSRSRGDMCGDGRGSPIDVLKNVGVVSLAW
jgi:hypothetical protein